MSHQKWIRWESERRIIISLSEADRSFTDLVELTDLSKPVLSQRLKRLKKAGKIEIVPEIEAKRFLYHLIRENLDAIDELFIRVYEISKTLVSYLIEFAEESSISDEEYVNRLKDAITMLFGLRLQSYMVAPVDLRKEWLKNTLGLGFVRKMTQIYPKTRNVLKYTAKGIYSEELATLNDKDTGEAVNRLIDFFDSIIEKITQR